jgi:hypothetical protein
MNPDIFTTILLDKPRRIRWSNRSLYRLQSLPGGFDFGEVNDSRKSFATLCKLLWAVLIDSPDLASPEDVAAIFPLDRSDEIGTALNECIEMATSNDEKKSALTRP